MIFKYSIGLVLSSLVTYVLTSFIRLDLSVSLIIGAVISLIWGYIIFVVPMRKLKKALELIDFTADYVDFTKLDTLRLNSKYMNYFVRKYQYLADNVATRVRRVNEEVDKSTHDSLSGCYNRTYLERMSGIYQSKKSLFVLFIDVNNLKKMNDIYGHEAGDTLIRSAASKLSFWDKFGDVYRIGGDEFMVVIPDIPEKECVKYIDSWYPTVGNLNRHTDEFKCFLAIGWAFGGKFSDVNKLQKIADDRMYQHKKKIKEKYGEEMR